MVNVVKGDGDGRLAKQNQGSISYKIRIFLVFKSDLGTIIPRNNIILLFLSQT